MTDPTAAKAALRSTMRRLRREVPDQGSKSRQLFAAVTALEAFSRARIVMVYDPLPGEPDPSSLVAVCQRRGVSVVRPHSNRPAAEGDLQRGNSPTVFEPESEPVAGLVVGLPPGRIPDLVIVPGLAFTSTGDRLGQGGGWYDRLLAALPADTATIGVCWSGQLIDQLALEPHDRAVDAVVTEAGLIQLPS